MVYRPARNYPLDLYYLMDMTHSMEDDKATLVKVGADLAAMLGSLTDNYRVGFGSFVDKPAMPFMSTGAREKDNQCAMVGKVYTTRHIIVHAIYAVFEQNPLLYYKGLREDVRFSAWTKPGPGCEQFHAESERDRYVGESGQPGGWPGRLDAGRRVRETGNYNLLYICLERQFTKHSCITTQIGWLNQSRKIVVFATDGDMHFAGDGLLVGAVRRNDRRCHLSAHGEYMAALQLDYPSLEEMYYELVRRKVSVIFVATHDVQSLYHQIQGLMRDVSSVGTLSADSSNILQLVNEGYANFVRKVHLFDDAPSDIRVRYESRCDGSSSPDDWVRRLGVAGECDNVVVGKEYEFVIHLTRLDDEADEEETAAGDAGMRRTIRVEEARIGSEFLQIDVELEDACPCMHDDAVDGATEIGQSANCNGHGRFKCGTCLCEPGWVGRTCECDATSYGSSKELEHQCRVRVGGALGAICADRGECVCGECRCNLGFTGERCECKECP